MLRENIETIMQDYKDQIFEGQEAFEEFNKKEAKA